MPSVLKGVRHDDPIAIYRGEKILQLAKRIGGRVARQLNNVSFAIDLFYSLYLPFPVLASIKEVSDELKTSYRVLKAMIESDEFNELRSYTIANSSLSTLVSASIIDLLSRELPMEELLESRRERGEEVGRGLRAVVRNVIRKVRREAQTIKNIEKLTSQGPRAGTGSVFDLDESGEDVIRLARNADIQGLLNVLSLMREVSLRVKRKVMPFSRGEFRGYDIGSDLERVVPTELALPERLFIIKYVESKLLLYEKVIPKDIGPIYVLVDKSGSMEGEKIRWAKATALALLMRSVREHRDFYLRFFNGSPHELIPVSKRVNPREVIELLKYLARVKSGGGTDITKALDIACSDIRDAGVKGVTDIVLITDGEDNLSDVLIRRKLKRASARLVTVMVIGENRSLRRASDAYLRATKLSDDEILRVVEA